jgi:hypothetical protein
VPTEIQRLSFFARLNRSIKSKRFKLEEYISDSTSIFTPYYCGRSRMPGVETAGAADDLESPSDAALCVECGSLLHGRFCHQCGLERAASVPPLSAFLSDRARRGLRSARRLAHTLHLLVLHPGQLFTGYIEGINRRAFVRPGRLFFAAALCAFWASELSRGLLFLFSMFALAETVGDQAAAWTFLLVALPAGAGILKVLFRRSQRLYLEHFVFITYVASFLLILSVAEALLGVFAGRFTTTN